MFRKLLLLIAAAVVFLPVGCSSPQPYPWSWAHNKRRVNTVLDGFETAAISFDRLILQDYREIPDRLMRAHSDFDRIVFGMDDRTLEDL
ncbi:MAG TPA: hypothetical protein PKX48_02105 [Planctomycetota bacterium]|nr:hypothetical protein [Planctomycetota bacterium]OQC21569.1 MAG: hypothetical protein BWX69_00778 [Planctomycetes bacterium ADurb.Bin069]NMD36482.1 hypothetical protein [Planctomycetota bacterium]HNR98565.1 hypothetical protein [Planctomycetota bacterium]HNU26110.1 hypothetical protein [Planctomycetota bacterium]